MQCQDLRLNVEGKKKDYYTYVKSHTLPQTSTAAGEEKGSQHIVASGSSAEEAMELRKAFWQPSSICEGSMGMYFL